MEESLKKKNFSFAVDCIIFGYDGQDLKLLVIKRSFEPFKGKWSLVGGFVDEDESAEEAAVRVLKVLTGLDGLYMEQLHCFSEPKRGGAERIISVTFFALIDVQKYNEQISKDYHPAWFSINQLPELIFDHSIIVEAAKEKLRYKAALHPLLFELLPEKFTMPQLQSLYEAVYDTELDKGNFNRKLRSTKLLLKLKEKDKLNSKKGAFYYMVDPEKYSEGFKSFLNFVPSQNGVK
jgi:ADP-ribose pyrophosphatase YjhB (NUDIX family)